MKRLGVFVFFDKNGIVDDYVEYLLSETKRVLDRLVIVCNGNIKDIERLNKFTDEVLVRDNKGFDAGAWKHVIVDYLQGDLSQYDECLFFNDTFYGPFYPMNDLFNNMGKTCPEVDFWGITKHPAVSNEQILEHIQTYFFVVKRDMLQSKAFQKYWDDMSLYSNVDEVIKNNEVRFTNYFYNYGFKYAVLCDTDKFLQNRAYKNVYITNPLLLLDRCKNPFIKKKSLILRARENVFLRHYVYQTERNAALEYIQEHYNYPMKYIWNNLNRTTRLIDRISSLGILQCIKNM